MTRTVELTAVECETILEALDDYAKTLLEFTEGSAEQAEARREVAALDVLRAKLHGTPDDPREGAGPSS